MKGRHRRHHCPQESRRDRRPDQDSLLQSLSELASCASSEHPRDLSRYTAPRVRPRARAAEQGSVPAAAWRSSTDFRGARSAAPPVARSRQVSDESRAFGDAPPERSCYLRADGSRQNCASEWANTNDRRGIGHVDELGEMSDVNDQTKESPATYSISRPRGSLDDGMRLAEGKRDGGVAIRESKE